jgi:hypothetical protein
MVAGLWNLFITVLLLALMRCRTGDDAAAAPAVHATFDCGVVSPAAA